MTGKELIFAGLVAFLSSSMATLGSETISVALPEGVSSSDVSLTAGPEGCDLVVVRNPVSNLTVTATGTKPTGITGLKVSDSTVNATPAAGQTAVVAIETTVFKDSEINNNGAGSLDVEVLAGKVKGSSINSGGSNDSVSFGSSTKLKNTTVSLGGGKDTVTFGKGTKIKKGVEIELGGKKNTVVIETTKGLKNLTVTGITKKDKFTVGGEDFTGTEAKNGEAGFEVG